MRFGRVALTLVATFAANRDAFAETVTYAYDTQDRLVQVVQNGGPASGTQTTYTQDAAGNRTNLRVKGAPH